MGEMMLWQLHWQNPAACEETIFVAQLHADTQLDFEMQLESVLLRRKHEMPSGWMPMMCDETCEHFVKQVDGKIVLTDGQRRVAERMAVA